MHVWLTRLASDCCGGFWSLTSHKSSDNFSDITFIIQVYMCIIEPKNEECYRPTMAFISFTSKEFFFTLIFIQQWQCLKGDGKWAHNYNRHTCIWIRMFGSRSFAFKELVHLPYIYIALRNNDNTKDRSKIDMQCSTMKQKAENMCSHSVLLSCIYMYNIVVC